MLQKALQFTKDLCPLQGHCLNAKFKVLLLETKDVSKSLLIGQVSIYDEQIVYLYVFDQVQYNPILNASKLQREA